MALAKCIRATVLLSALLVSAVVSADGNARNLGVQEFNAAVMRSVSEKLRLLARRQLDHKTDNARDCAALGLKDSCNACIEMTPQNPEGSTSNPCCPAAELMCVGKEKKDDESCAGNEVKGACLGVAKCKWGDHPMKEFNCLISKSHIKVDLMGDTKDADGNIINKGVPFEIRENICLDIPVLGNKCANIDLDLRIEDLDCHDPHIEKLGINSNVVNTNQIDVDIDIDDVVARCTGRIYVSGKGGDENSQIVTPLCLPSFLGGSCYKLPRVVGDVWVKTAGAELRHKVVFESQNFTTHPPVNGTLDGSNCKLDLTLDSFGVDEISSGPALLMNDWAKSLGTFATNHFNEELRSLLNDKLFSANGLLPPLACTELSRLLTELLMGGLESITAVAIQPYVGEAIRVKKNITAALSMERTVMAAMDVWNKLAGPVVDVFPTKLTLNIPGGAPNEQLVSITMDDLTERIDEWNKLTELRKVGDKDIKFEPDANSRKEAEAWFDHLKNTEVVEPGGKDPKVVTVKVEGVEGLKKFGENNELSLKNRMLDWEGVSLGTLGKGLGRTLALGNLTNTPLWGLLNDLIEQEFSALEQNTESWNYGRPRLNQILQNLKLGPVEITNGTLVMNLTKSFGDPMILNQSTMFADFLMYLRGIRVAGLDKFTKFNPFEPVGTNTFFIDLELHELAVEMDFDFDMVGHDGDPSGSGSPVHWTIPIHEEFTGAVTIHKLDFETGLFFALDYHSLFGLKLGQLIDTENGWYPKADCFLRAIFGSFMPSLYINAEDFTKPELSEFVSRGIDTLLNSFVDAAFAIYKNAFLRVLPNLMDGLIRETLNDAWLGFISSNSNECNEVDLPDNIPNYMDFITNPGMVLGRGIVRDELGCGTSPCSTSNRPGINGKVLEPLCKRSSGSPSDLVYLETSKNNTLSGKIDTTSLMGPSGFGEIELVVSDARFANINSVYNLRLLGVNETLDDFGNYLYPDQPYILENEGRMAYSGDPNIPRPLTLSFDVKLKATGPRPLDDFVTATFTLNDLTAAVNILAKLDLDYLLNLNFRQLFNFPTCLLATIPSGGIGLDYIKVAVKSFGFKLECKQELCTSPGIRDIIARTTGKNEAKATKELTTAINKLLDSFAGKYTGRDTFISRYVDTMVAEAHDLCEEQSGKLPWDKNETNILTSDEIDAEITGLIAGVAATGSVLFAFAGFLGFHALKAKKEQRQERQKSKKVMKSLKDPESKKQRMKRLASKRIKHARSRVHGTKNLISVFLCVVSIVGMMVGGGLPWVGYQPPTDERSYGLSAGLWGTMSFYMGSECDERKAQNLVCWSFLSYGSKQPGAVPAPKLSMAMKAASALSCFLGVVVLRYSQKRVAPAVWSAIQGLFSMGVMIVWDIDVCGSTTNVAGSTQWALRYLWPDNPKGACYHSWSWYLLAIGTTACLLNVPTFWFNRKIGARFGKLGDDGSGPPHRPVPKVATGTKSLARSSVIPLAFRIGIPISIALAYVLFYVGHVNIAASVDIIIKLAGNKIDFTGFQQFSIVNSVKDLLRVNAMALAMLLIVFSIMWPYTKLTITTFLFFAPPLWVHPDKRGDIYIWLDVLGKWSMTDIFTLFMFMVAFNININSPGNLLVFPTGFYSVSLMVTPLTGLYSNMLAQLVSQFVSHAIIYHHRNVLTSWSSNHKDDEESEKGSLASGRSIGTGSTGTQASGGIELCSIGEDEESVGELRPNSLVRSYASLNRGSVVEREMQLPRDPSPNDPDRLNMYFFVLSTTIKNCCQLLFSGLGLLFLILACALPSWSFYPATTLNALYDDSGQYERNYNLGFGLWGSFRSYESEACTQQELLGHVCLDYTTYFADDLRVNGTTGFVKPLPRAQISSVLAVFAAAATVPFSQRAAFFKFKNALMFSWSGVLGVVATLLAGLALMVWDWEFCDIEPSRIKARNAFYKLPDEAASPHHWNDCLHGWAFYFQWIGLVLSLVGAIVSLFSHRLHQRWGSADETTMEPLNEPRNTSSGGTSLSSYSGGASPRRSGGLAHDRRTRAATWMDVGTTDVTDQNEHLINTVESVKEHVYAISGADYRIKLKRAGTNVVNILLFLVATLGIFGCVMPGFTMSVRGLVGVLLEFGEDGSAQVTYSVFDVGTKILSQATDEWSSKIGLGYMVYLFIFCTAVVPLLQMIALALLWNMRLTLRQQKRVFLANEALGAWQYMEVWLIAIVLGVMQIGDISAGLVGRQCSSLQPFLDQLAGLGVIPQEDTSCFVVSAEINLGLYILLMCSVCLAVVSQIIVRAADSAMEDRVHHHKCDQGDISHRFASYFFRSLLSGALAQCLADVDNLVDGEQYGMMAPYAGGDLHTMEDMPAVTEDDENEIRLKHRVL